MNNIHKLRDWWDIFGPKGKRNDSGQFAQLRRCRSWEESLIIPCTHHLLSKYDFDNEFHHKNIQKYCTLAILASYVKEDSTSSIFSTIAKDKLKIERFNRLYRATDINDRFREFRNLIKLCDNKTNLAEIEEFIVYTNDTSKIKMTQAYFKDMD